MSVKPRGEEHRQSRGFTSVQSASYIYILLLWVVVGWLPQVSRERLAWVVEQPR